MQNIFMEHKFGSNLYAGISQLYFCSTEYNTAYICFINLIYIYTTNS